MVVLDFINSIGTFGALCAAIWQLRKGLADGRARDETLRVERALAMFEEVVAGSATAEAFHRLSVALRGHGSASHGLSTWHRLSDKDLESGRFLDYEHAERDRLFADLYTVMWFFERAEVALDRRLVDREALMATLGFHFWWWGQVLLNLRGPKAAAAVHSLAESAERWARREGVRADWNARCQTDFEGGGPMDRDDLKPARAT